MAAVKASNSMVRLITEKGAEYLGKEPEEVDFDGEQVFAKDGSASISLKDIGNRAMANNGKALEVTESHSSPVSPPPFMVGMAEIEMDKETCDFELVNYVAVVDCVNSLINPAIVRVQTEGGLGQGIGMAMFEDVTRSEKDRFTRTPSCSTSFRPVWMWVISRWNLRAATSPPARLVSNPSERLSLTRHPRPLRRRWRLPPVSRSGNRRSQRRRFSVQSTKCKKGLKELCK